MAKTTTSYVPKLAAAEAGGNKWQKVQMEIAKFKDAQKPQADNGWGNQQQMANPYDFSQVMNQANQMQQNAMQQIQPMVNQQQNDLQNRMIQMMQQTSAIQAGAEGRRNQYETSETLLQDRLANDGWGAATRYGDADLMQNRQLADNDAGRQAQLDMLVRQNQQQQHNNATQRAIADRQAAAATEQARIAADAGVLSSFFGGVGGGGYARYW